MSKYIDNNYNNIRIRKVTLLFVSSTAYCMNFIVIECEKKRMLPLVKNNVY